MASMSTRAPLPSTVTSSAPSASIRVQVNTPTRAVRPTSSYSIRSASSFQGFSPRARRVELSRIRRSDAPTSGVG